MPFKKRFGFPKEPLSKQFQLKNTLKNKDLVLASMAL